MIYKYISLFSAWLIIFAMIFSLAYASRLPAPPVLRKGDAVERQYLKTIYDNFNKLEGVTTNPNNNKRGDYGEAVLYKVDTSYYLEVCISEPRGTSWQGVKLSVTP